MCNFYTYVGMSPMYGGVGGKDCEVPSYPDQVNVDAELVNKYYSSKEGIIPKLVSLPKEEMLLLIK